LQHEVTQKDLEEKEVYFLVISNVIFRISDHPLQIDRLDNVDFVSLAEGDLPDVSIQLYFYWLLCC
jgi:hypothetical protein